MIPLKALSKDPSLSVPQLLVLASHPWCFLAVGLSSESPPLISFSKDRLTRPTLITYDLCLNQLLLQRLDFQIKSHS